MKVGEKYRLEIEWQSVGARKSHDIGSIVPTLAKNARTGHPTVVVTPDKIKGRATRPAPVIEKVYLRRITIFLPSFRSFWIASELSVSIVRVRL